MKRLIKLFISLSAVAFVGASCTKAEEDMGNSPEANGTVLLTVGFPETRIAVTPSDKEGASVVWEANDKIAIYDKVTGVLQASFKLVSGANTKQATFSMEQGGIYESAKADSYTVVYPFNGEQTLEARYKKLDEQVQDGNGTATYIKPFMSGNIAVNGNANNVSLTYEVAIFTAIVEQPTNLNNEQVTKFTLYDDMGRTYNVALNNITAWSDGKPLTVHVMIMPRSNAAISNYRMSLYTKPNVDGLLNVYSCEQEYKQPVLPGVHYYKEVAANDLKHITGVSISDVSATSIINNEIYIIDISGLQMDTSTLSNLLKSLTTPVTVVMPYVDGLPSYAFMDCKMLKYIDIPEAKFVGMNAFEGCTGLTGVNAPKLNDIRAQVFKGCTALRSVAFAGMKQTLGESAFAGCTSLVSAEFPNMTSVIGVNAFNGCVALKNANFPNVTKISNGAFQNCDALVNVNFPNVTEVLASAFQNDKNLKAVVMPKTTTISDDAFNGCTKLSSVNFPNATNVGARSFLNCSSLVEIDLPLVAQVNSEQTFEGCTNIKMVSMPKLEQFSGDNAIGSTFKGCTSLVKLELGSMMMAAITGVSIGVVLKDNNFENCKLWLNSAEQPNVRENPWTWFFVKFNEITFSDMPR